ncbi:biopolymer transporter ExbD [Gillisia sp. M10.2A]|uniref:Biopolymer transporter ExbD n=1 Tax=Gillisia lutea TaxID=2909668 RepID=A0ABS9EDP3_9FLAO|nr:biopolymer transporter ExbD [Gillisia lutea]MCF4100299.1 biopolymer transporter ExbD [Gillisia lutea]
MAKRSAPEVNAGSMADIAFLLLIFFLVTTTIETDRGISRKLPPIQDENVEPPVIKQKNIFTVIVNRNNDLLVEDELMQLKDLRKAAMDFLDNGAGTGDDACTYCQGAKDPTSSDNPEKAIISLVNDRKTEYRTYISVQNELVAAYNMLRNREARRMYGKDFTEMEGNLNDPNFKGNKAQLEERVNTIKEMYPQKLSEAEPKG